MRINSFRKIELQAKAYLKRNWERDKETRMTLEFLNSQLNSIRNEWDKIERKHCALHHGGKYCTCDAIASPLQEVRTQLQQVTAKINAIYTKERAEQGIIYQAYHGSLLRARVAKEKYLANN